MKMIKDLKVIYAGVFLDENSLEKLVELTHKLFDYKYIEGIFDNWITSCTHLTMAFGENVTDEMINFRGTKIENLSPYRILYDGICCGMFFQREELEKHGIPWINPMENAEPHITMQYRDGVEPKITGTICGRNHSVIIADPDFKMSGRIGMYMENGLIFF